LVLASYFDTMLYDPATERTDSFFCLEPGWSEMIEMRNEAVAIDAKSGKIYAAPEVKMSSGLSVQSVVMQEGSEHYPAIFVCKKNVGHSDFSVKRGVEADDF
jgi:hypothetical protein